MAFQNRIGQFEVPLELINTAPHLVKRLMAQCVIVKAELDAKRLTIKYVAYHNQFDEIENTVEIPYYTFTYVSITGTWVLDSSAIINVKT